MLFSHCFMSRALRISMKGEIPVLMFTVCIYSLVESYGNILLSEEIKIRIEPKEDGFLKTTTTDPYLPRILSSPSQLSVEVGDSVVLPCRVDHLGKYVVIWKRGRTTPLFAGEVRLDQNKKFSLVNRTHLQIERVTPQFSGEYICEINSKPVAELVHTLHVLVSPTIRIDPPDGYLTVKQGEPALAQCIADGYPTPVITWRAIKGSLPGGVREKQGTALAIPSADVHHTGIYECEADNGVGEPATANVRVKVYYAPELGVQPTWAHVGVGSSVEFMCVASSEPPSSLFWTKRDTNSILFQDRHISLFNSSKSQEEHLNLKIQRITHEHFGTYTCFANNTIGSSFQSVEISGLAEPVKFRSNSSGDDKESFMLSWTVTSYSPIIEYLLRVRPQKSRDSNSQTSEWTDVMIPVEMQQRVFYSHSYNITGLKPATAYEVVMQARNDFGWNHPSETFTFWTFREPLADEWEQSATKETLLTSNQVNDVPSTITDMKADLEISKEAASSCTIRFSSFRRNWITLLAICIGLQSKILASSY